MDLQQVKKDLENGVLISPVTWLRVLETALELKSAQDELVAALKAARVFIEGDTLSNPDQVDAELDRIDAALAAATES